ncbi:MAG: hypothetical protein ABJB74_19905 [Gemmatimonas sp.]
MNDRVMRVVLRAIAVVIALLAAVDPAMTSNRASKPEISVLSVNAQSDSALTRRVSERLSRSFTVLNVAYAASAATVLVGSHVPQSAVGFIRPVFAVSPDSAGTSARIESVLAPKVVAVDARVPITAVMHVQNAKGKQIELNLLSNGSVVDRVARSAATDDERVAVPLSYVPTASGAAALRVTANIKGAADSSSADAVINVREQKWAVLFYDARPSWMSTFVRRAIERDPRFAATSRIVTSTNVSTDAGKPPGTLDDPTIVDLYDAVVVGAPESLSERDVQGLESFLRRRGGSVVLLFDGNKAGKYERLAEFTPFTNTANSQPAVISEIGGDSVAMRTTEWMWPNRLPVGATVLAFSDVKNANPAARRPIVWAAQAGAGRVIVSGALDAWKFRAATQSGFEKFWQQTIAAAAAGSAPAIEIALPSIPAEPGAEVEVAVTSRVAALADLRATSTVRAELAVAVLTDSGRTAVRVWPTGSPGSFRGIFRAPGRPGTYSIIAAANGSSAAYPLVVTRDVRAGNTSEPGFLAAFVASHGGSVVTAAQLNDLPSLMQQALQPMPRRVVWYPMRSLWWLLPFAVALSIEWFLRRRRGLP